MTRLLLLGIAFAAVPAVVEAAAWDSSCQGLSEEAFIIIVVESIIILLLLLTLVAVLISGRRQRRKMMLISNNFPMPERGRYNEHSEPLVTNKERTSLDSGDEEDVEQSSPFLPVPRAVLPETLHVRSMSLSTRDSIHSPELFTSPTPRPPRAIVSQASEGPRPSRLGQPEPESFAQPDGLPNPYSDVGHGENLEEVPPESPTEEGMTLPSVYSQPSLRTVPSVPHLKPIANTRSAQPDVPSTPTVTDLSRNTTTWSTSEGSMPSNPAIHTAVQPFKIQIGGIEEERPFSVPAAVVHGSQASHPRDTSTWRRAA